MLGSWKNANLCEKVRGSDVAAIRVLVGPIEQQPVELLLRLRREGVVESEVDNLERHKADHYKIFANLRLQLYWSEVTWGLWASGTTTSSPLQWQWLAAVHWSLSHLQYSAVQYSAVQCSTVQCSTV